MDNSLEDQQIVFYISKGYTLRDIAAALRRSVSTIHDRCVRLERLGFLNPPRHKGNAKDRTLTTRGIAWIESLTRK